jgi:23S rRNA (adenine2503-C2)-methyltransferase
MFGEVLWIWTSQRPISRLNCKVNLTALNPGPGIAFGTPTDERVASFQEIVRKAVPCFVRKPRGRDVYAACGQLKRVNEAGENREIAEPA